MDISAINLVYFSATYTTRKVARLIAGLLDGKVSEHDITQAVPETDIALGKADLLVVGMPVYAGRIPAVALEALGKFKGDNTLAILVGVYGNRDYDDALLEMKDLVEGNGFKVVGAGAFIAQHSIFPAVGAMRPDEEDILKIKAFANQCKERLGSTTDVYSLPEVVVKGKKPYKVPGKIPLKPKGNRKCDKCGTCVRLCPVQAIPEASPRKTDKSLCISCGRCIVVCPQKARHFGGILYKLVGSRFAKTNSARKEAEWFL